jgi:hypothetical protein
VVFKILRQRSKGHVAGIADSLAFVCERRNAEIREEFRQRELERARKQSMESDLQNWRIAVYLRTLVAQVSSQASDEQKNAPGVTRWIKWANRVASVNDLLHKGVATFVERDRFCFDLEDCS